MFLNEINDLLFATNKNLQEATHVIITYGTSWVYRHIETDAIVGNCHKIPQKKFLKELKIQRLILKIIILILPLLY